MRKIIPFLLAVLAVCIVYFDVWQFDYVWDDVALFVNNPTLRQADEMMELWSAIARPLLPGTTYFRPAVLFTFWSEFRFTGAVPSVSHVINLLLHLVNVVLIGVLVYRLWPGAFANRALLALVPMLFYGLNPALHEAVSWVSGRFDLMATTFVLVACVLALYFRSRPVLRSVAVSLAFLLGLLSKEVAVVTPLLVMFTVAAASSSKHAGAASYGQFWIKVFGENKVLVLGLILAFTLYLALRLTNMPSLVHVNQILAHLNGFERVALIGRTISFYAVMALLPFRSMSPQHPYEIASLGWVDVAALMVGMALVLWLLVWAWRMSCFAFFVLAAILSLVPVMNIIPLTIGSNIGHERFLTLPMAMLAAASVPVMLWAEKRMSWKIPSLVCVLLLFVYVANLRVTVPLWRNELSLWSWAYSQHPNNPFVQHSLGTAALKWNDVKLARDVIDKSRAAGLSEAMSFMETDLLVKERRYTEAVELADRILASRPRLYLQYRIREDVPEEVLNISAMDDWYLPYAFVTLARAHIALKQFEQAQRAAEAALFYAPNLPPAKLVYSYALLGQGKVESGLAAYQIAWDSYATPVRDEVNGLTVDYMRQLCTVAGMSFACDWSGRD